MKLYRPILCGFIGLLSVSFLFGQESESMQNTAEEILKKADNIRNPGENYLIHVNVDSTETAEPHRFFVAINGNSKTRIETTQPQRDKGRNMLMLDENMWVYVPNLKREVRVSLNQKLVGEAANGDISRMRWSGDYKPTIEKEDEKEWQLFLKGNKKGLTYDSLRIWVDKKDYHPTKGEYLTGAGKVLKKVTYEGYKQIAGGVRPTQIVIEDAVKQGSKSTINITDMRVQSFPGSIFNKNELDTNHLR